MIYILSWTTKKHQRIILSGPLHSKLKKIQGLFKEKWNSRTFQGRFQSVQTLTQLSFHWQWK